MSTTVSPLLRLPLELRDQIFFHYFNPASQYSNDTAYDDKGEPYGGVGGGRYEFDMRLMRVNKQIYDEARATWKRCATFVLLKTPWPTAVHHISTEGFVPIVCSGSRASRFEGHTFEIEITAPRYDASPDHTLVLLLDDIESFAQTWFYSQLSYPVLNTELHVHFKGRRTAEWGNTCQETGNETSIPLPLQRRFLLPFTRIKSLRSTAFTNLSPAIVSTLEEGMNEPVTSLQACLENCAALLASGDELLNSTPPQPAAALETYQKAFHAIHVIIKGRTRHVLAEVFFHAEIPSGQFRGQSGSFVRIYLRIKLVSRYVLAFLRLKKYNEAAFWGLRSMRIMREAMSDDFEEFLTENIGMSDFGPLCARTAIAFQLMEEQTSKQDGQQDWSEDLESYQGESLAKSAALWELSRKHLRNVRREDERKIVLAEIKEFGIVPPVSLEPGPGDMTAAEALDNLAQQMVEPSQGELDEWNV